MTHTHFYHFVGRASFTLIAAITALGAATALATDEELAAQEAQAWRSRLVCGRNSLYLFLKCHGYRVDYAQLRHSVPVGELGSSFGDLQRCAQRFGAAVEIWKTSLDRLASADLPAIVLLEPIKSPSGHFVLLVDIDHTSVLVTDPTSTSSARMPRAQFLRSWSGFAMVHRSTPLGRTAWGLVAMVLGGVLVSPALRRRRSTCATALVCCIMATLGGCDDASVGATSESVFTAGTLDHDRLAGDKRPLAITYHGGLSFANISRTQYQEAIRRCRMAPTMSVSNLLHMLRLKDIDSTSDQMVPNPAWTSQKVLKRLLNSSDFESAYGGMPFLIATRHGARFSETAWDPAAVDKRTREAHVGQALSIFAELALPLDTVMTTSDGAATLADVVEDSLANFTWDQELYWIGQALVMYLPPERVCWKNKCGDAFSFEALAERLLGAPPGESGPCGGTHALYTLSIMLQAQERSPAVFSPSLKRKIEEYMRTAGNALADSQSPDGSWPKAWSAARRNRPSAAARGLMFAPADYEPIWITGHILEYQVLLPEQLRLPEERLTRAAAYIVAQMGAIPSDAIQAHACAYTHGLHAIQAVDYADRQTRLGPTADADNSAAAPLRTLP